MMESFLAICKQNYLEGITPSNRLSRETEGYKKIVAIAKDFFEKGKYNDFAGYLMEGQYLISLWAAHMLVEYGGPGDEFKAAAIETIKDYSNSQLTPTVAGEERRWLDTNEDKYKEYL